MTLKGTDRPSPPTPTTTPPPELTALWDMDSADYECDCPGPPPEFRIPPPPRPPFLQDTSGTDCSETPLLDLETCDAVPVSCSYVIKYMVWGLRQGNYFLFWQDWQIMKKTWKYTIRGVAEKYWVVFYLRKFLFLFFFQTSMLFPSK